MRVRRKSQTYPVAQEDVGYRIFPSSRLGILLLISSGCFLANAGWFTLNFGITCMVNATYLAHGPTVDNSSLDPRCSAKIDDTQDDYGGTFKWDRSIQSNLLAAEAWGATIFSLPIGYAMDRVGARWIYLVAAVVTAVSTALIPTVAYISPYAVLGLRMLQGLSLEISWPACMVVCTKWFPAHELGPLLGIMLAGFQVGSLFTMATSGIICSTVGWPYIFYLATLVALLVAAAWLIFYSDNVENAWYVSEKEKHYISKNCSNPAKGGKHSVPYRKLIFSPAVIAIVAANFSGFYVAYFVADFLPTYLKEVLLISATSNGVMSALPFLMRIIGLVASGFLYDLLIRRVSPTLAVKLFAGIAGFGPSIVLILMPLFNCTNASGAVTLLCLGYLLLGQQAQGFSRSTCVIAPEYTGTIAALGATASYMTGIVGPYITGALTPYGSPNEWHNVLYVTAAVGIAGTAIFVIWGSGERQSWAMTRVEPETVFTVEKEFRLEKATNRNLESAMSSAEL